MSKYWENMSPRERRLAVATASVLIIGLVWMGWLSAVRSLAELDEIIEGRQQELVNFRQQMLRQGPVDEAFARIATQHSSAWTAEEIRAGLHREIFRLALRPPPPADTPVAAGADAPRLVRVPSLPDGVINAEHEGYREYAIEFRVQPAPIADLIAFITRLQESAQVLRIDSMELSREPDSDQVAALLRVTRTVVDGVGQNAAAAEPATEAIKLRGDFEGMADIATIAPDWRAEGCDLIFDEMVHLQGEKTLRATAQMAEARLACTLPVTAGSRYLLTFQAVSLGQVDAAVATLADANASLASATITPTPQTLTSTGAAMNYTFVVDAPSGSGSVVLCFLLKEPNAVVYVDDVRIRPAGSP